MASRRRIRGREAQIGFEALSIEGALLSPEWLARIAQLGAGRQTEADYGVPKGLHLRDEIGRYWRIAQAHWAELSTGRAATADPAALAAQVIPTLLRDAFGFGSLTLVAPVAVGERTYPIGHAALGGRVPVVIAPAGTGIETLLPAFGDGTRRRTAFGLAQEHLNAADDAMWGVATDGVVLRIVRDNASLTRPAWVEADLGRIFTEDRYADFAALWLLLHESRFGRADQPASGCVLEAWRSAGREEGTRAREHLRRGVQEALEALGQGFLAHPENGPLRAALETGTLTRDAYFQELLRLVYRLIFLLTAEERGLLHPEAATDEARRLYAEGYGLRRLRERSVKRSAHDRFADLWEATKIVLRGVASGEPRLGLPALSGLFAPTQCPTLDASRLENRALLLAVFRLSWLREASGLARVNWRDMGPEELGSVYESLLELVPQIREGRTFTFATGAETKGNARKTTGSYYTPDSLVHVLLDSALEPVIASTIAASPGREVDALLELAIVDPACGSGHFLLAAARRLGGHVARLEAGGTPTSAQYRHAVRQVVSRCIYGVDLNPMAVELCRVSLWMEAIEPGLPLTFLRSHIRHGNSLLGTTPELMAKGIPDEAWSPIEGDDKKVASALKKRNKQAREGGQRGLGLFAPAPRSEDDAAVARAVGELEAATDADAGSLAAKESRWEAILASDPYRHAKFVADAWCAAFVWPKQAGELDDAAPTNELWRQIRDRQGTPPALTVATVEELAEQYRFFHWHLAFPQVFERGGFDVVLGNPPWERITFEELEWFAERAPEIAGASTASQRKSLILDLRTTNAPLFRSFLGAKAATAGTAGFCINSGLYSRTGLGHLNTYALFAERTTLLVGPTGMAGIIAPTALLTGDYSKAFTAHLLEAKRLVSVYDFDNRARFFPDMQPNIRFAIVVTSGPEARRDGRTVVASQLRDVAQIRLASCALSADDLRGINPETGTIPFFYTPRDAQIVARMYARRPSLFDARGRSSWTVDFNRMLNMSDDSGDFVTLERLSQAGLQPLLPVYEAKYTAQFDHRAGTFEDVPAEARFRLHAGARSPSIAQKDDPAYQIVPRYWLPAASVAAELSGRRWFLVYRDAISATADARSLAACMVPALPSVHTLLMINTSIADDAVFFIAAFNSFVLDYVLRQKATGAHAARFIVRQLPFLTKQESASAAPWSPPSSVLEWIACRVIELTYTSWDLEPFASDVGYKGRPFHWNPARRFLLRCELDAAFFHLYGLSRDETAYVMETFPIVRKNDERAHGNEYRTKSVILEIYEAMAEAMRTGVPYQTRLDPPPADVSNTHRVGGGKVLPFRPSVRPQPATQPGVVPLSPRRDLPAWSPELLPAVATKTGLAASAGRWATTLGGIDLGIAALAAVLRNMGGPASRDDVERAVVLSVLPGLLRSKFDAKSARKWRTAIGPSNMTLTSIATLSIPWAEVRRRAEVEHLLVVDADGRWRAGTDIDDAPSDVLDARALVALSWLESVSTAAIDDAELVTQLGALRVA